MIQDRKPHQRLILMPMPLPSQRWARCARRGLPRGRVAGGAHMDMGAPTWQQAVGRNEPLGRARRRRTSRTWRTGGMTGPRPPRRSLNPPPTAAGPRGKG
jgi:hypothetical protein